MRKTLHLLRALLLVVLALVIVVGVLGFVLSRQSFPQIEGTVSIPGLNGEVEVIRDEMGIPHIFASSERDLFMAQGYVQAQDRFFQMDVWRHIGAGRTAEMFGSSQVETDVFLRTLGWARVSQLELDQADPAVIEPLQYFADGVNAYLSDHQGAKLSFEYVILKLLAPGYAPEAWKPLDSMTLSKMQAYQLSGNFGGWEDLKRAQLRYDLGEDKLAEFLPPYSPDHPIIVPDPAFGDQTGSRIIDSMRGLFNLNVGAFTSIAGSEGIGSNSWVISGDHTDTGAPILANDPHLSIQLPAIWYEVGLHCIPVSENCRIDVTGFSFASTPGVVIGHNDRIAWGFTNLGPDVVDLYIEKVNPSNPDQYEVNGEWVDMDIIQEEILVAGKDPVPVTIRYTRHGPIISDMDDEFENLAETTGLDVPNSYAVSLRWTGLEVSRVFEAILGFDLARNWEEFREAASLFAVPSQNILYADIEGNIGYQTPGLIPIRAGGDGLFPVPGWTDEYEWIDFIPFDELPSSYNPPQGYIVTANNAVVGADYPHSLSTLWAPGYRAQRIVDLIEGRSTISVTDVQVIHGDNFHAMGPELIPILSNINFEDSEIADLAQSLDSWDFQNDMDSQQAAVFNAFWRHMVLATFEDELPDDVPGGSHAFIVLEGFLDDQDSTWWDDHRTSEVETRDMILKNAFIAGIEELKDILGRNVSSWTWGDLHTRTYENQIGIGPLGLIFNRGPYPTSGGSAIVNATSWSLSEDYQVRSLPSMRMVVDLSNLSNSVSIHTTGQSGHTYHPHYIDMSELWGDIQYHPMLWSQTEIESSLEGRLILMPE
jgi:penicillin amidase